MCVCTYKYRSKVILIKSRTELREKAKTRFTISISISVFLIPKNWVFFLHERLIWERERERICTFSSLCQFTKLKWKKSIGRKKEGREDGKKGEREIRWKEWMKDEDCEDKRVKKSSSCWKWMRWRIEVKTCHVFVHVFYIIYFTCTHDTVGKI